MKREGRGREEEDRVFRVSAEINMQRGEEGEGRGGRARKAMREENTGRRRREDSGGGGREGSDEYIHESWQWRYRRSTLHRWIPQNWCEAVSV